MATLGAPFSSAPDAVVSTGDEFWGFNAACEPGCAYNPSSQTTHPAGTTTIAPGQVFLGPGPQGEYAVLRFTAAAAGRYSIEVGFVGVSGYQGAPATTSDGRVLVNGVEQFSAGINVDGGGNQAAFSADVALDAGGLVDVLVGQGNGNYDYDSTGVSFRVCGP